MPPSPEPAGNHVCILLGSNIDKERNLPEAVRMLAAAAEVIAVSSIYETLPMGLTDQPNFFNATVLVRTALSAAVLKAGLLSDIERALKRVRQADKNAPRTIDLDISLYNDETFDYPGPDGKLRHVPDRDLLRFAHAALPAAELLPDFIHPETGERLEAIAERLLSASMIDGRPSVWARPDIDLRPLLSQPRD